MHIQVNTEILRQLNFLQDRLSSLTEWETKLIKDRITAVAEYGTKAVLTPKQISAIEEVYLVQKLREANG